MKSQLVLVPSERMDNNQKQDRNEDRLIRMGVKARENLGLKNDKSVELWPDGDIKGKINHSKLLSIFQAFSSDLKELQRSGMSSEEYHRVGFVTTKTFRYICGSKKSSKSSIWIADTIEDTIIGADPEFMLMQDGDVQYAGQVGGFGHEGELGSDGPLAELRPIPAVGVDDFIENIQGIFKSDPKREVILQFDWVSGCFFSSPTHNREFTVGGHAHIGTPAQVTSALTDNRLRLILFSCLQKILDEYIAVPTLKIEGKIDGTQRRHHYGHFGDFRTDYGRLEYRTLSGMWLTHPKLASAVMGSLKAVAHAFYKIAESRGYDRKLLLAGNMGSDNFDVYSMFDQRSNIWKDIEMAKIMKAVKSSAEMIDILHKGQIKFDKEYISALTKKFRSLDTYNAYAKYIDMFMEILSLPSAELEKIDRDIKHNWLEGKKFIV